MTAGVRSDFGSCRTGRLRIVAFVLALLVSLGSVHAAGDPEPAGGADRPWREKKLGVASLSATAVSLSVDVANNAYIAAVVEGKLGIAIVTADAETYFTLERAGVQGDPRLETTAAGETFVSFTELTGDTPEARREVLLGRLAGASLVEVRRLTENRLDDYAPRLALGTDRTPHLVWAQRVGESSRILYWSAALGAPRVIAPAGDAPSFCLDAGGGAHVAYLRGGEVVYMSGVDGVFDAERLVTSSLLVGDAAVSVAAEATGTALVLYADSLGLFVAALERGAGVVSARQLDGGGILDARIGATRSGDILIGYSKAGDVLRMFGPSTSLGVREMLTETPAVESQPSLGIDGNGTLHAAFLRDAVVYYATDARTPEADFSAQPRRGPAPLTVRFTDLSSSTVAHWEWDLGDGATSRHQHPEHTYKRPGVYSVRLKVAAPGGVSGVKEAARLIVVDAPLNELEIPDQRVLQGARDLWFPIVATHVEAIHGFQLVGTYDPRFLELTRADLALTSIRAAGLVPELLEIRIHASHFEIGCLFETGFPFDGVALPASDHERLIHLIFDVAADAPEGASTEVRLVNDPQLSRISNTFIVDGFNRRPLLEGSTVEVREAGAPRSRVFVRGDVDDDGAVTVGDAVTLLAFLFQGGPSPACPDAADFSDTGSVDMGSAVSLLAFLFQGGRAPATPYPNRGLDPSDDAIGECLAASDS